MLKRLPWWCLLLHTPYSRDFDIYHCQNLPNLQDLGCNEYCTCSCDHPHLGLPSTQHHPWHWLLIITQGGQKDSAVMMITMHIEDNDLLSLFCSKLIEQWKQIAANLVILVATNLVRSITTIHPLLTSLIVLVIFDRYDILTILPWTWSLRLAFSSTTWQRRASDEHF